MTTCRTDKQKYVAWRNEILYKWHSGQWQKVINDKKSQWQKIHDKKSGHRTLHRAYTGFPPFNNKGLIRKFNENSIFITFVNHKIWTIRIEAILYCYILVYNGINLDSVGDSWQSFFACIRFLRSLGRPRYIELSTNNLIRNNMTNSKLWEKIVIEML